MNKLFNKRIRYSNLGKSIQKASKRLSNYKSIESYLNPEQQESIMKLKQIDIEKDKLNKLLQD